MKLSAPLRAAAKILIPLLAASAAFCQDVIASRVALSLKGLHAVLVSVRLSKEMKDEGLDEDTVKTDVELKLRLAGISVLEDWSALAGTPGRPSLAVSVEATPHLEGIYAANICVALDQDVLLVRNPAIKPAPNPGFNVRTGYTCQLAIGSKITADIRDKIKDLTDDFINAYLSVNPK